MKKILSDAQKSMHLRDILKLWKNGIRVGGEFKTWRSYTSTLLEGQKGARETYYSLNVL